MAEETQVVSSTEEERPERSPRAEIDTSAPFESVKEAATRFGGIGFWKPSAVAKISLPHQSESEALDIVKLEEEALYLEKDLIVKERETLDVLKELENTKSIVEDLKLKLLREEASEEAEKENRGDNAKNLHPHCHFPSSAPPGLILMELKQAKLNLSRTTSDLVDIRSSVDVFNKKLEKERLALEKTRVKLTQNSSKITSLEEELSHTKEKLRSAKEDWERGDGFGCDDDNPVEISRELRRLSDEVEKFKKLGDVARSEVSRATREIEETRTRIKTAETRLVAARKMKQAARAAEAVALAEIKAISSSDGGDGSQVTISFEEYLSLARKAQGAEEASRERFAEAMGRVEEAEVSRAEILRRVEEATKEVKTSKEALEEALSRVGAANQGKLVVEEALRRWRADHHGQRRRSSANTNTNGSAKFKNSSHHHHRRDSRLLDVNGTNLASDEPGTPVLKQTLSIGQILSRKLNPPEDIELGMLRKNRAKPKLRPSVSLGQMLSKKNGELPFSMRIEKENNDDDGKKKQFSGKRKKFGFGRFSLLLTKQSRKKKKTGLNLK